ncbi:hypothetical protein [Anaerobacterium chartisolvens]|uniref:hypothetical protein n=1 Tax=Anaerobacterium chartisolvens TaxID=1297424 RepID=UPI000DF23CC6|nr:hypothetical protein [Anaerobacterium chartisolvens]
MAQANRFYKSFLIFANEDDGFSSSGTPSGYAKILVRDGKGVIDLNVHNLKENPDKLTYRLYIMKNDPNSFLSVCMGTIPVQKNKGIMQWEFDADNVGKTGVPIEQFNAAAIQAQEGSGENVKFKYPLSSCKNSVTSWKKLLNEASNAIKGEAKQCAHNDSAAEQQEIDNDKAGTEERNIAAAEEEQSTCEGISEAVEEGCEINHEEQNETLEAPYCSEDDASGDCIAGNDSSPHVPDNTGDLKMPLPDMGMLRSNFNSSFEPYDPFGSNRKDYKWWKVNNPVQLGNIFHQSSIRAPFFFNPLVMMAHYKYRYLIVGIYEDKTKKRDYMVCGIPGVYGVDDKPFGDLCRWVQIEGNKPRYGAFGYWLIYMEPDTGKILEFK